MRAIVLVCLLGLTGFAHAGDDKPKKSMVDDPCRVVADIAGNVMRMRQSGLPITEAMDGAGDSKIVQLLVMQAYEMPKFSRSENREESAVEFSNRSYLDCRKRIAN